MDELQNPSLRPVPAASLLRRVIGKLLYVAGGFWLFAGGVYATMAIASPEAAVAIVGSDDSTRGLPDVWYIAAVSTLIGISLIGVGWKIRQFAKKAP